MGFLDSVKKLAGYTPLTGFGLVGGGGFLGEGGTFGAQEGGFESATIPKWNAQQNELFRQLYGQVAPNLGKAMTPTPEESKYGQFMSNYEPWYRQTVGEAYDPQAVRDYYQNAVIPEMEQTIAPKVAAQYGGPGYWGSARARAVSDLYAGVGRQEAADIYGVERMRSSAIADLVNKLPIAQETAAKWSRMFTPEMSPYFEQAMKLLGLESTDTLAAYRQGSPGLIGSIAQGAGQVGGQALAKAMFA